MMDSLQKYYDIFEALYKGKFFTKEEYNFFIKLIKENEFELRRIK